MKNVQQSVKAKLKNIARETNRDYNSILRQYFQERFLYRLSKSKYRDNFILKGGLLLFIKNSNTFRPTKDIDLLINGMKLDEENIKHILHEIFAIECTEDGVYFDKENFEIDIIEANKQYEPIRIKSFGYIGQTKEPVTIDLGIGDIITPHAVEFSFPTLLPNELPLLKCYNYETVIAEKLQAAVWLYLGNSRMKDIYDIHFLLTLEQLDNTTLIHAIQNTFEKRNTGLEKIAYLFQDEYINSERMHMQWQSFLRRIKADFKPFDQIIQEINEQLPSIRSLSEQLCHAK